MNVVVALIMAAAMVAQTQAADFQVTNEFAGPPFVGFGAQMNGWTYCEPNAPEVNDRNVKDFERKVIDLRPQHVRIFIEVNDGSPQQTEADVQKSVLRTIALSQRAGATINLTVWHGPYPNERKAMQRLADYVRDLRHEHKLSAVQYVTIQNEPNSFDMDKEKYCRLYRDFDEALKRDRIRNEIKIVAGDLLSDDQEAWWDALAANLWDVADGWSCHMYSDYWDEQHLVWRIEGVMPIIHAMPQRAQKPVYITEFGIRGYRKPHEEPGKYQDGRPIYDTAIPAVLNAWVMLQALNRGFVGAIQWDMVDLMYDKGRRGYGLIGEPAKGWPLKPHYWMTYLFTHTMKPGWRAMKVTGEKKDLTVAAMTGPDGATSVYFLNRGNQISTISVGGLPSSAAFSRQGWNEDGKGVLSKPEKLSVDAAGMASVSVSPQALVVLTNRLSR